jgi:hypothetical protein
MQDIFEISNNEPLPKMDKATLSTSVLNELVKLNNNETEGTKEHITQKPERVKLPRKKHDITPENKEKMLENLRKGREARKAKSNDIMKQLSELKTLIVQPKEVEAVKPIEVVTPRAVEQPKVVEKPKVVEAVTPRAVEQPKVVEAKPINKPVEAVKTMVTTTLPIVKQPVVYSTFKKPIW